MKKTPKNALDDQWRALLDLTKAQKAEILTAAQFAFALPQSSDAAQLRAELDRLAEQEKWKQEQERQEQERWERQSWDQNQDRELGTRV